MTEPTTNARTMTRLPGSRAPRIILSIVVFLLLAAVVFIICRDTGLKNGQRDARLEIESESDITAGPENLMQ